MDDFDIEKLNKSQIILLTLLTSFVTSIATGIVTVSLMNQAPPAIAQTVNRVVERTVEKVMQPSQAASVATSKTVVIKESDLIAQAIDQVSSSIVRIYAKDDSSDPAFLGIGIVLDKSGNVATDAHALAGAKSVMLAQSDGTRVLASLNRADDKTGVAYLLGATSTIDGARLSWSPVTLAGSTASLGESVFTLSGNATLRVADGIVTALGPKDSAALIDTNISASSIIAGSPLMDTDGTIIGISTSASRAVSDSGFVPSASVSVQPKASDVKAATSTSSS